MTATTEPQTRMPWLLALARNAWFRAVLAMAVLLAVIGVGAFVYTSRPVSVEVATVEENVPVRVFGLGTIEARVLSKIGFEVGATLSELNADHGDRVSKGQVLARLNAGEQEAKVAKARAASLIAEANIKKSQANLEKMQAVLAQKQLVNQRRQTLVGRDVVTQQSAEESVRDEAVAKADVAVAQSDGQITNAQRSDARAQGQFEETLLRHRTLVAPFDGVVIERHKELGTVIKPGDPVFTLIAAGTYWGLAHVDEARAGFIQEGQRVDGHMRSRPQEAFTGVVARIGLESDRVSEERRVYIRGDNPPSQIYLGEQVELWITVTRLDKALLVPEAAVQGYNGREGFVWTVESGRLQRRLVQFRHRTEDARLELTGGLPPGARVIVRLNDGLREGRAANPVEVKAQ